MNIVYISMSLVAFKKKSVIQFGTHVSGKGPGGYWLPQGPFGANMLTLKEAINNFGPSGFSLNGGHRNKGRVGTSMKMSQNGTPFRGKYAMGNGGQYGNYYSAEPVFNANQVITQGTQYMYIKPSSLSTKGMLEKKYKWINNGQYPNYWVQPVYGSSNLKDNASQGTYINQKSVANMCHLNVNSRAKYEGNVSCGGPTICQNTTAKFKMSDMFRNAPYTKEIARPVDESTYMRRLQRKCANPHGRQKPFPFAVNGDTCNAGPTYVSPPEWYILSPSGIN